MVSLQCCVLCYAKSLQSCPTLCDPRDGSPPGSPFPGILQARTLEWVAISFSNAWKWKAKVKSLSRVRLLVTPWIAAHQAPPSMEFSKQEYWSGVQLTSPQCCVILFIFPNEGHMGYIQFLLVCMMLLQANWFAPPSTYITCICHYILKNGMTLMKFNFSSYF